MSSFDELNNSNYIELLTPAQRLHYDKLSRLLGKRKILEVRLVPGESSKKTEGHIGTWEGTKVYLNIPSPSRTRDPAK